MMRWKVLGAVGAAFMVAAVAVGFAAIWTNPGLLQNQLTMTAALLGFVGFALVLVACFGADV